MRPLPPLLLAGLAALLPAAAPPRVDPRLLPGDAHDLVLLHPPRPYRVRLHLQPHGRSFVDRWRDMVAALLDHLDADRDGKLDEAEARAAPSRTQWAQMLQGAPAIEPEAAPRFAELAAGGKDVKAAQLAAYYDGSVAGPLHVRWSGLAGLPDPLSGSLWKWLDADRDGKLSKAELLAAPRALAALDRDEDELISPAELFGVRAIDVTPAAVAGVAHGPAGATVPLLSLRPGGPAAPLTVALLKAYDRDRDGKLTAREAGLPPAAFRWLDRDADGKADEKELASWRDLPPDVSLIVPIEDAPRRPVEAPSGPAVSVTVRAMPGGAWLGFGDHVIEVRQGGGAPARPTPAVADDAFTTLDRNGDGFLDAREAQRPPFRYVAWLRLADRDGDGRVSRKEFDAFAALLRCLRGAMTVMRVDSEGRSLFRLLDADGDGVLGPREVRSAWQRVAPWCGEKGVLSAGGVPRQFRVTLAHGSGAEVRPGRRPPRGPLWFTKMDRNGDGDVSLREWLGTKGQFAEIDADRDGLISPEEAERADRMLRARD